MAKYNCNVPKRLSVAPFRTRLSDGCHLAYPKGLRYTLCSSAIGNKAGPVHEPCMYLAFTDSRKSLGKDELIFSMTTSTTISDLYEGT